MQGELSLFYMTEWIIIPQYFFLGYSFKGFFVDYLQIRWYNMYKSIVEETAENNYENEVRAKLDNNQ